MKNLISVSNFLKLLSLSFALIRGQIFLFPRLNSCRLKIYGSVVCRGLKKNIRFGKGVVFLGSAQLVTDYGSKSQSIYIGDNVTIENNVYLNSHGGSVTIEHDSFLGVGAIIQGMGGVYINKFVMLGPYVQSI
jgi:carbonic anhydrase/acetyltransferase-like protein (isoleucine patch superfamily)